MYSSIRGLKRLCDLTTGFGYFPLCFLGIPLKSSPCKQIRKRCLRHCLPSEFQTQDIQGDTVHATVKAMSEYFLLPLDAKVFACWHVPCSSGRNDVWPVKMVSHAKHTCEPRLNTENCVWTLHLPAWDPIIWTSDLFPHKGIIHTADLGEKIFLETSQLTC